MRMTYLNNGETLKFDPALCTGCGKCIEVCPHAVFRMNGRTSSIVDRAACMECGACARNCAFGALTVKPGVGCAAAIIGGLLRGKDPTCGAECGCGGMDEAKASRLAGVKPITLTTATRPGAARQGTEANAARPGAARKGCC
jgi:NAD-dependent dihydropyrimidine dehydrogenase PreA subunit